MYLYMCITVIGDTSQSTLTNHENMNMIIAPCTTNDGMDSQTNSMMKTDTDNEHSLNVNIIYFFNLKLHE